MGPRLRQIKVIRSIYSHATQKRITWMPIESAVFMQTTFTPYPPRQGTIPSINLYSMNLEPCLANVLKLGTYLIRAAC